MPSLETAGPGKTKGTPVMVSAGAPSGAVPLRTHELHRCTLERRCKHSKSRSACAAFFFHISQGDETISGISHRKKIHSDD